MQARAAATRQKIIDAAVELFTDQGYAETGLNDITDRAGTTTGAFYYHFESREGLAWAIVQQGWPKALEVLRKWTATPSTGLENVIAMTFALSDLMKRDKSVWIANHLNQALGQLNEEGRRGFRENATTFVEGIAGSLRRSDVRGDVTVDALGSMVWVILHGCHLLSDAMMDNVFHRLTDSWRMLLPAIVPAESLAYFEQFLTRTAVRFEPAAVDEFTSNRHPLLSSPARRTG